MKKKQQTKIFYKEPYFWYSLAFFILLAIFFYLIDENKLEFKVTRNFIDIKDNIINFCYSENDCGKVKIGEEPWKEEWLNQYCKILSSNCTYVQKVSLINSSKRYFSNTIETPNCLSIDDCFYQVCEGPIKYQCQNYVVEIIK